MEWSLGDPIPDESGKLKFEVLLTDDGQNWRPVPAAQLPDAIEGEGAFAASNTCIAILPVSFRFQHLVRHRGQSRARIPLRRSRPELAGF